MGLIAQAVRLTARWGEHRPKRHVFVRQNGDGGAVLSREFAEQSLNFECIGHPAVRAYRSVDGKNPIAGIPFEPLGAREREGGDKSLRKLADLNI